MVLNLLISARLIPKSSTSLVLVSKLEKTQRENANKGW